MNSDSAQDGVNVIDLQKKLSAVENEYDVQRAKLKELYLQKEAECKNLNEQLVTLRKELDETKSQVLVAEYKSIQTQDRKAQEEIASLQHLVQETVEESSFLKSEIDRLAIENERLRAVIASPQSQSTHSPQTHETQSSTPSFAPVLSHVKKTLVRKLAGDSSTSTENLEESMRKAQEDAEVLRSLVIPLEGEIKALKEKLRSADEEIQKLRSTDGNTSATIEASALVGMLNENRTGHTDTVEPNAAAATLSEQNEADCTMCKNYESQLVFVQSEKDRSSKDIERLTEELSKEAALRCDLERKWQEKRDKYNEQVQQLVIKVDLSEKQLAEFQRHYAVFKDEVSAELLKLSNEREMVHRHLTTLQDDNDFLAGRYMESSEEMQNQIIDFPSTVEELQETLLQSHQSLIEARVGCEFAQRKCESYADEAQVLRDQFQNALEERKTSDRQFTSQIKNLETQLKTEQSERLKLMNLKDEFEKKENDWNKERSDIRGQIIALTEANEKLERHNLELKNKISVLQQDLGSIEFVNKSEMIFM